MEAAGKLILSRTGERDQDFTLAKATITLGRASDNDIVLRDGKSSRYHARLEQREGGYILFDLQSTNGTRINGVAVEQATLQAGAIITLGDSLLRFESTMTESAAEMIPLESEAELDATIGQATLSMTLTDTSGPRLAMHVPATTQGPARTWELPLMSDGVTIGRQAGNDIVLDLAKVSRHHARIERQGNTFVIRDLASTNGTWIAGQRIVEHPLADGVMVRIGEAQLVFKGGFHNEDLTLAELPITGRRLSRRPVVIVPGFMGSELWRGSERVWPNVRYLFTNPEMFYPGQGDPLEPRGIVNEVVIVPNLLKLEQYRRLGDFLVESLGYERGKDLLEFAYDWRQDVRHSARRLAEAIDRWAVTPPITIIAHSLGCLVSRYYVEHVGGTGKVGRLILMGGPHYGVPRALTSLLSGPDLLPFGLMGERLRQVLESLPSSYQILPTYTCIKDPEGKPIDVLSDETWLSEKRRPLLRAAREFRQELGTRSSVPAVSIFGYGLKTITGIALERDNQGQSQRVASSLEPGGDTSIPETSAILEGSEIHPVQQYHGVLFVDNDVKMRLKLELAR